MKETSDKLKKAFNKIETPNNLNEILSDCKKQNEYVYLENTKNNTWFKGLAFAFAAILIITTIGLNLFIIPNQSITTIAFDVNPSIELEMNKNEEIIKVNAINDDAKIVLEDMNLEGVDLDVAVNALIGSMIKHGYLNELANSILVSVNSNDNETVNRLQTELMDEISQLIQNNHLEGAVLTQRMNIEDKEIEELSNIYGITKAKTQLIKEILKTNHLHTFEDLVHLSINELNLISESKKDSMSNINSKGHASDAKYIGKDKALKIALYDMKLTKDQITDLEIEIDYEMEKMVYEIEFEYNNLEYDYDINALNGEILNLRKHNSQSSNEEIVVNGEYIGKEKVKEIVLNHVNLKENQIQKLWIELEKEDGQIIYTVDFKVSNVEYDFEINAVTGQIVDFEKEIEDYDDEDEDDD